MKTALLFLATCLLASAESVTFKATQDSDIYAFFDAPSFTPYTLNVGADPTQAHSHHSLIQFNIASLAIPAAEIGTAKLRLYSLKPDSTNGGGLRPGNVAVLRQGKAWSETGLHWNSIQAEELAGVLPITQSDVWVEVDVTALVAQWASGAKPNYGFVLRPESETLTPLLNVEFISREVANYEPQLVITRSTAPPVPPVLTIAASGGDVTLTWPVAGSSGWTLQEAADLAGPWAASTATANSVAGNWQVTHAMGAAPLGFYRLTKP
jgi:hypothetical protein